MTTNGRRHAVSRRSQGFAVGVDGTPLYYRMNGPLGGRTDASGAATEGGEARTAVCFSDGIGCEGYVWKYLEAALAGAPENEVETPRPIIHWHYRGHGKTPLPRDPERITVSDCADDLVAVLDAAGDNAAAQLRAASDEPRPFERVVLAGHSMGVQVCLEAWRRHPERVAGLVLVCGAYGTPLRTFKNSRALEDLLPIARLAVHAMPRAVSAFFRAALPTDLAYKLATTFEVNGELVRPEDFKPYLEHMACVDPRLFVDMLAAAGRHTAREILPSIDVPTLIIAGDRDGFTPLSLSEEMHALIPNSVLHIVKSGSHTAPIEKPDEVNAAVTAFLRDLD